MFKKTVSTIMLSLMVISTLTLAFKIQLVRADDGTIIINADGSISPTTAPIYTADNITYTLTGNITDDVYGIVIERGNIVVDGAGYTVNGTGGGDGIDLTGVSNVTIKNTAVEAFDFGIWLAFSSNDSISGNNITANTYGGIGLQSSSGNSISRNNITANNHYGIQLYLSSGNSISENTFTNDDLFLRDSYQNSVENNTVNGRPLVYLEGLSNLTVNDDAGQVVLVSCENIAVEGLNLSQTNYGIELVETSNITISGNNITNMVAGILLYHSSSDIIYGNNITNDDDGIVLTDSSSNNSITGNNITNSADHGIVLYSPSNYNSISGNNITNNEYGIWLSSSGGNRISGNNISLNNNTGLYLYSSCNNVISGNNATANNYGILLEGSSNNNSVSSNNATANIQGIWLYSSSNNTVSGNNATANTDAGIEIDSSSNNTVSGNNATANSIEGIFLYNSSNNIVSRNNATANYDGIMLWYISNNNTVSENNVTANSYGIWLDSSSNNTVYHNSFIGNSVQASVENDFGISSVGNAWDYGYPSGGNYWSDYNGTDSFRGSYQNVTGSDGIGDTPYVIDANNLDNYPLMSPWMPSNLVGDLNGDGKVSLADLQLLASAYNSKPGDPNWNPLADLAPPYGIISLTDLVTLAMHYGQRNSTIMTSVVIQASDPNDPYLRYWGLTFDRPMPPMVSFQGYVGADVNEVHYSGDTMIVQWTLMPGAHYLIFGVTQVGGPNYGTYSGNLTINGNTYNFSGLDGDHTVTINLTV